MKSLETTVGINGFTMIFGLKTIGTNGFAMVFGVKTIGTNGYSKVFGLMPMVFQWFCSPATIRHDGFSMVSNGRYYHWSNDGMVTIHCRGLMCCNYKII